MSEKGFNTTSLPDQRISGHDFRELAHAALEQMLANMHQFEAEGASAVFDFPCSNGHIHPIRLMLHDMKDEKECVFCGGTGVEWS